MHRTEGDSYVTESGKRRFKDQDLPTYPGTVDTAEYNNAVQEEICNLIELLGGTVTATAAADRTAGWRQLYDILLEGENITDAAMSDFDLAKGFGSILSVSGDYDYEATFGEISVHNETVGAAIQVLLSAFAASPGLRVLDEASTCLSVFFKGMRFAGGPGEVAYDVLEYRRAGFLMTAGAFFPVDSTNFCDPAFTTDIPTSCEIISATIKYATSGNLFVAPAMLELVVDAGFWKVVGIAWTQPTTAPNPLAGAFNCFIEYDAAPL